MKNNIKSHLYGPNWRGQRCEAVTRKGTLCQRPGSKRNGRCKLHGGHSSGPKTTNGLTRLTASKIKHGNYIKEKRLEAKQKAKMGRVLRAELSEIEQWFIIGRYLNKDWKKTFS